MYELNSSELGKTLTIPLLDKEMEEKITGYVKDNSKKNILRTECYVAIKLRSTRMPQQAENR